ncbi:pollen allergen Che a 1-like [Sesamum indicum]|uniref:Pollen allergen Che a 1-like n=1 Tax=Sesamum indicum TaxID=4182 RepID=A0A6I9UPF5_SESIN|nr:pollen allergen Che a 1-like [Sesamum indicum]
MTRLTIVLAGALCLLSLAQVANSEKAKFIVRGDVYCDYCRATFVTQFSKRMPGAEVKLVCRDDFDKDNITFRMTGIVTDDKGEYTIEVEDDHKGETCEVTLVKSSMHDCAEIVKDGLGRKPAADVVLTNTNFYHGKFRNASSLTFSPKKRAPECIELKKEIEEDPIPLPDH